MPEAPTITYTLAVHNCAGFLEAHVRRLVDRLERYPSAEVILVENGSSDGSLAAARDLARRLRTDRVDIRVDSVAQGLGNAHRRGLALARGDTVVVIGADLPFGFCDLDQWDALETPPELVLGSKSHPRSATAAPMSRRICSFGFRLARQGLLGLRAGDTQGSILIDGRLARRIQPHLTCSDYLVTTEICAWAHAFGATQLEIPVTVDDPAPSTVSPLRDGVRMLRGMVALRRRLRAAAATVPVMQP